MNNDRTHTPSRTGTSWQNRLFSLYLRARLKPLSRNGFNVNTLRKLTAKPPLWARTPAGWHIRQSVASPLMGEWIEPRSSALDAQIPSRVILYLHGGGYFFGSPASHRPITIRLAVQTGARVFALDYRRAPEWPFPCALEDALAAYDALARTMPASQIVLAGDSAGGGLTLATLLALRDAQKPLPSKAIVLSPWTDLAATGASITGNARSDPMFHAECIRHDARHYLKATPATHPLASPLYAELSGLPPLLIQASSSEVLLDDSRRFAGKATRAGVDVRLSVWHGLPHVWQLFCPLLPEARAALDEAARFITEGVRPAGQRPSVIVEHAR